MKLVRAIVRPITLDDAREALERMSEAGRAGNPLVIRRSTAA